MLNANSWATIRFLAEVRGRAALSFLYLCKLKTNYVFLRLGIFATIFGEDSTFITLPCVRVWLNQ